MELGGARALVTGASSGIGAALAERLAIAGATVGICGRRRDRLEQVLARCRAHAPDSRSWVCDLSDAAQVDRLAADALGELGGVDVLVNNAGVPKRRHVLSLSPEVVEAVVRVNFLAPVRLTLALVPQMVQRGRGLVVNVSSVAATLSSPNEAAYDASKAALSVFSEATALDLWDTGVRVLVVYPGVVDTELLAVPDNDPLTAPVEKIPVGALVDEVMDAIARDAIEVYVPAFFKGLAAAKAADVPGFLAGAAAWVREQRAAASAPAVTDGPPTGPGPGAGDGPGAGAGGGGR